MQERIAIAIIAITVPNLPAFATADQPKAQSTTVGAQQSIPKTQLEPPPPSKGPPISSATVPVVREDSPGGKLKCQTVTDGSNRAAVCVYEKLPEFSVKDAVAIFISALALAVSIGSVWYTRKKDQRVRRQSVVDDFWIRKVISPIAVEPFIKGIADAMSKLPADCESKGWSASKFQPYIVDVQPKLQEVQSSLHSLSILDKDVCRVTQEHLERIEDLILDYCGCNAGNRRDADGQCKMRRLETSNLVVGEMLKALEAIKTYQISRL